MWTSENKILEIVTFAEKLTGRWNIHAQHGRHTATIVTERDTLPSYGDQGPLTGYKKKKKKRVVIQRHCQKSIIYSPRTALTGLVSIKQPNLSTDSQ